MALSFSNSGILNRLRLKISEVKIMSEKDYFLFVNGQRIQVSKEVYEEYYYWERQERYFMNDLKKGKMIINSETGETTIIPSKEVSYEQYFRYGEPFAVKTEIIDEQMIDQIALKEAMQEISEEERELIWELFFLEKTERQVSEALHIAKSTLHHRRNRILKKLKKYLEEDGKNTQ